MIENIKCVRCGVCCSSGVCQYGIVSLDSGLCIYLILSVGDTSCKLILENKIDPNEIGIGKGCILRYSRSAFHYYKNEMKRRIEYLNKVGG